MGEGTPGAVTLPVGGVGRLRRLAHEAAPAEVCGVLVGTRGAVDDIREVGNIAGRGRFEMDPDALLGVLSEVDDRGLSVVGSFHSHPGGRAEPSDVDVREAIPGWVTVIIGRRRVRAWSVEDGEVTEVPLVERTW
jgi:proteasome lid subunit RPN8/RPN11